MPNNTKLFELLRSLFNKPELNSEELKELYTNFNSQSKLTELHQLMDEQWETNNFDDVRPQSSRKILSSIQKNIQKNTPKRKAVRKLYQWSIAAAAALLLSFLISASYFLEVRWKTDTHTLLTEITAPNGKIKIVTLPDSTRVWLNPGSSIIYPEDMNEEKIRDVRLWGQAYFKVAKNARKPFILQMGDIGLKVLGTSFNASNYKEDATIDVVLKEGKVSLFQGPYEDATSFSELNPGQSARYTKGHPGFNIQPADVQRITSWINGELIFRDELMSDVFRQLERWYNVKIIVSDPQINNYLFTATIKTESLKKILELLEFTSQLEYEVVKDNGYQNYKPTILIKYSTK
ncbi:FecR family protein [Mangrovibacterium lignilyticum]|uniref:FecR family protein n=1 Tax=Mangrovibacterium lignilyticum TaxID=2668052 RepID=UPI0013D29FBE|nr:FecR family protein [Mangrovibacterium lignilyticum]